MLLVLLNVFLLWFLCVKTDGGPTVRQRESRSARLGDAVTLDCRVRSGPCSAGHIDVKWLKKTDTSAPRPVASPASKESTCNYAQSGEATCVYSLLMRNLSWEDAGTYYCVAASCEQTVFGKGTRLVLRDDMELSVEHKNFRLLVFSICLPLCLCFVAGIRCLCTGSSASYKSTAQVHPKSKRLKGQMDDTWSECVYLSADQKD